MALRAGRFSNNARLEQASNSKPSIRQGEKGEAVATVQQALLDLGFAMPASTGNGRSLADGIFGQETASVVRQFQTANGLVVDGIIGRVTLAKLDELILVQSAAKEAAQKAFVRNQFNLTTAKPAS